VIGIVMAVLPSLGHLSVNTAEYGVQNTETPQPLRDPAGTTSTRVSRRRPVPLPALLGG
jgi:hypothetical protein